VRERKKRAKSVKGKTKAQAAQPTLLPLNVNGAQSSKTKAKVENLATLARRVRDRERKNRTDQLEHVKRQAADVRAARLQCEKRGQWKSWCKKADLSPIRGRQFNQLGKLIVTIAFQGMTEDEQWAEWQRIQGNTSNTQANGRRDRQPRRRVVFDEEGRRFAEEGGTKYLLCATVVVTFDHNIVTPTTGRKEVEDLLRLELVHWVLKNGRGKALARAELRSIDSLQRLALEGGGP
jgi:hypothetical protein